jgi:small subunit ribosomal protein S17
MAEKMEVSRQTKTGVVTSDKMDKTVVVSVERRLFHQTYGKVVKRTSKFKAHDEKNECGIGDKVLIMETRPLSRGKRWTVKQIIQKAK